MKGKVKRTVGEPENRLGRIARRMTEALENDPERGEERAIVILTVDGGECMTHFFSYDDAEPNDELADLLMHTSAVCKSVGLDFQVIAAAEVNHG